MNRLLFAALVTAALVHAAPPEKLELKKDDHIAIVGNQLADRMQHAAWLEALIYAKFPADQLVFRNLAAPADEVATWHRSQDFGSRDDWMTWEQTDVVFAFYGFNEAFKKPFDVALLGERITTLVEEKRANM